MSSATHARRLFRALAAGLTATIASSVVAPVHTSAAPPAVSSPGAVAARLPANATVAAVQWYVNTYRQRVGVPPVTQQWHLNKAAYAQASDMARRHTMSHVGSDGSNAGTRISRTGYRWWIWGENVAAGQVTVYQVMSSWYNSPSHRAIMLDRRFRHMGLGRAVASNGITYWCLVFASPR